MTIQEAKESVVQAGKKLVESKLIARTWGNVSCRISESRFVVTPRGRDYMSLTAEEIVEVEIADCSYTGDIKPSSEKAIHAAVYKQYPDVNFVIHTHQEYASVVSAVGIDAMKVDGGSALLGEEVVCAAYALPTTKKLARGVANALKRSKGNAVILTKHGALCFGVNEEEAFRVANELEAACRDFVANYYLRASGAKSYDPNRMRRYAVSRLTGITEPTMDFAQGFSFESERTDKGFKLQRNNCDTFHFQFDQTDASLPKEARMVKEIYQKHKNINYIVHADHPNITAVSCVGMTVRPLLDDFAQLAGTSVKTVDNDPAKIGAALKSASAVLLRNHGALCCGVSKGDATAVAMVMEKNCHALIGASLFGKPKPIHPIECALMRFSYLKSYSKQANKGNKN